MPYDITDDRLGDKYNGCFMYDDCLECSEAKCVLDDHKLRRYLIKQRNYFIRLLKRHGFKAKKLPLIFGLSLRSIHRIGKTGKNT